MKRKTLVELANMICGDRTGPDERSNFKYRSSKDLNLFFEDCDMAHFVHDGSTRKTWVERVLKQIEEEPRSEQSMPSEGIRNVIRVLMDQADAPDHDKDRAKALHELNVSLLREHLEAFYADDGCCYLGKKGTGIEGGSNLGSYRPLSTEETHRKKCVEAYLKIAAEDEVINTVLLPLFQTLGFQRVSAAGHKDKLLEYGKDVWMKFLLPTRHWLYFGVQAKKGKINAAGRSDANVSEVYHQALMMVGNEIFDPDINKRKLVDHAIIAASGEITKLAKNWLGERLDASQRSQILFLDREEIVRLFIVHNVPLSPNITALSPELDQEVRF